MPNSHVWENNIMNSFGHKIVLFHKLSPNYLNEKKQSRRKTKGKESKKKKEEKPEHKNLE